MREKRAEIAAHMAARAASAAPPANSIVPERETEEFGGSINSCPMELNTESNEEEGYVEEGYQMGDSFNPSVKENLMPHNNSALASNLVSVQNSKSAGLDKETSNEENDNPTITEVKAGHSQFNADSIPSSSIQRLEPINEETLAASP
nr:hypothetical protein CFP56_40129 [Quercus suber]